MFWRGLFLAALVKNFDATNVLEDAFAAGVFLAISAQSRFLTALFLIDFEADATFRNALFCAVLFNEEAGVEMEFSTFLGENTFAKTGVFVPFVSDDLADLLVNEVTGVRDLAGDLASFFGEIL